MGNQNFEQSDDGTANYDQVVEIQVDDIPGNIDRKQISAMESKHSERSIKSQKDTFKDDNEEYSNEDFIEEDKSEDKPKFTKGTGEEEQEEEQFYGNEKSSDSV